MNNVIFYRPVTTSYIGGAEITWCIILAYGLTNIRFLYFSYPTLCTSLGKKLLSFCVTGKIFLKSIEKYAKGNKVHFYNIY